jgi:cytochrome P450
MTEVFDPGLALFSTDAANDPHSVYARLRSECPVSPASGFMGDGTTWYLSRYEDIIWAMRHPEVFSSSAEAVSIGQAHPLIPLQVDPPEHAQFRRVLDPEFSPKRVAELEPDVRALAVELIERFVEADGCDFHLDFATPLPSTVFLRLLGLPQSDLGEFMQWRDDTVRPAGATAEEQQARRNAAGASITRYFEQGLDTKRAEPGNDLLTRIAHGSVNGRPFTRDEQLGICHLQLLAGLDTVTATLDCMVAYLAQHPDRRRALIADPALVDKAVEELLRSETPVQVVPRVVAQDFEFRGQQLKAGDHAVLVIGAADTDPSEFDAPTEVTFDRPANRHLAFGGGPHRCLGSHLARMELRVALDEFHRRVPDYELAPGAVVNYSPGIRQADHLPLVFLRG